MKGPQQLRLAARPVPPATPASPVDAARQERFLRQLVPSPWDEPAIGWAEGADLAFAALPDPADEAAGDGDASGGEEQDRHEGDEAPTPPAPPPAEHQAPAPHALPPWPWMHGAHPGGQRSGGDGPAPATALAGTRPSATGDAAWLHDVVEQVSQLAAGGDARFQHWSITVPLDPQALPDCELRMALSPGSMALRFRTGCAQSSALVSRHRDALRARLEALPSAPPAIDIDLE